MENVLLQHHWQSLRLTIQPPALRGSSMVFDPKRQQAVLLAESETWLWNGANWSKAQSQNTPPARNTAHLVYDATSECVLLCGGVGLDGTPLHDVWLWDGTAWTEQQPVHRPLPVGGAMLACDSGKRQVLFFGGLMGFDGSSGSNRIGTFSNTTWTWDGATWTEQATSGSPPARADGLMVYDEARQQTLLFGGYGPTGYLNDMWLWNGSTWVELSPSSIPPLQTRAYATFHKQMQQVILFIESGAGTNPLQCTYQIWLWNGTSWSQNNPQQALPGSIEGFTYDGANHTIVAYIVTGGKVQLPDKQTSAFLPELAAPTLGSETWLW